MDRSFFCAQLFSGAAVDGRATNAPIYLWIIAEFIFIIGLGYGYCAWTNRDSVVFIAVGAVGKLAFFTTLLLFCFAGELPLQLVMAGSADLVFGSLFIVWLTQMYRQSYRL